MIGHKKKNWLEKRDSSEEKTNFVRLDPPASMKLIASKHREIHEKMIGHKTADFKKTLLKRKLCQIGFAVYTKLIAVINIENFLFGDSVSMF